MTVRTRYAPSPTGALHIGNVRSGLFAYLFARHNERRIYPAHRRHRPGAFDRGVARRDSREPALARRGVGRGAARPTLLSVEPLRPLSRGRAAVAPRGQGLPLLLHRPRNWTRSASRPNASIASPAMTAVPRPDRSAADTRAARQKRRPQLYHPLSHRRAWARLWSTISSKAARYSTTRNSTT